MPVMQFGPMSGAVDKRHSAILAAACRLRDQNGGIPGLIAMLSSPHLAAKQQSTWALDVLTKGKSAAWAAKIMQSGALPPLLASLTSGDAATVLMAGNALVALGKANTKAYLSGGVLPQLMRLITRPAAAVPLAALVAISALADSGNKQALDALSSVGIASAMYPLLEPSLGKIATSAAIILDVLATESDAWCAAITEAGCIPRLAAMLAGNETSTHAGTSLASLSMSDCEAARSGIINGPALNGLVAALSAGAATAAQAGMALSCLARVPTNKRRNAALKADALRNCRAIAGAGAIPPLVRLLSADCRDPEAADAATLAADVLYGMAACRDPALSQAVIDASAMAPLRALSRQPYSEVAATSSSETLKELGRCKGGGGGRSGGSGDAGTQSAPAMPPSTTAAAQPAVAAADERCAACGRRSGESGIENLKSCGACHSVRYCGQECQRAHWRIHKAACQQARQ